MLNVAKVTHDVLLVLICRPEGERSQNHKFRFLICVVEISFLGYQKDNIARRWQQYVICK